jgi:ATP-binding cassette subfamily G (WHITE) protein 2 (SNQ2)
VLTETNSAGKNSSILLDYFAKNGAPCPTNTNPAEHIVDVVQGRYGTEIDWPELWNVSAERQMILEELDALNQTKAGSDVGDDSKQEARSFATPIWYQILLVTRRQVISLWRNPDYVWNKIGLHVSNALFGGFTFWMINDSYSGLAQRLYAIFNFVFVAPGCINQLQPLFIHNRDIFETREKKV